MKNANTFFGGRQIVKRVYDRLHREEEKRTRSAQPETCNALGLSQILSVVNRWSTLSWNTFMHIVSVEYTKSLRIFKQNSPFNFIVVSVNPST